MTRCEDSNSSTSSFEISRAAADRQKTKFVVRKIPSFISEEEIKQHLDEFIGTYNWFFFCSQPKVLNPTRRNKTNYNRFYINFQSFDDAVPFIQKFQTIQFEPQQNENQTKYYKFKQKQIYKLIVEFAPNQEIPKPITVTDSKINTIHKHDSYLKFIESIERQKQDTLKLQKETQEELRRKSVTSFESYNKKSKSRKSQPINIEQIAPLAKHVANRRNKRTFQKKMNRQSLIKSEKAKERHMEKMRERRRRKRIALTKAVKYGTKRWVPKKDKEHNDEDNNDENVMEYNERKTTPKRNARGRRRGGAARGRGRGRGRSRGRCRGRGRGRGRGRASQFSGYSSRKGQQTWQRAQ